MKIAILDDYQDAVRHLDCFTLLQGHEVKVFHHGAVGVGQLALRLAPFDALVLIRERSKITRALLKKLPNLKLIAQTGKFSGHVDIVAAQELGITLLEGSGDPTAPAELTWALIMAASRKIDRYAAQLQTGSWQVTSMQARFNGIGRVLKGRTLGIWGYGKIGQIVAGYGRAFGMQVLVWGSARSCAQALQNGYHVANSKESFFQEADVLSLHLRLTSDTRGAVQLCDLLCMKSDALLVNTSRAELIEEGALLAALEQGKPGFAAIDVFESEPVAPDHPLLRRENVLATPHLGYVERDSYEHYFGHAFQNILDFLTKK
jgi:D-3-phosphoglycerate dehydrogenase